MLEFAGPLAVAALVLAAGGVFKLVDPAPTRGMYVAVGLPDRAAIGALAVVSGLVEVALGAAAFLWGGRLLAAGTAVAFFVFTALTTRLVRTASSVSCGCFGRQSGRATWVHVGVDAAVAGVAAAAAVVDAPGFLSARDELPAAGVPFLAFAALGTWLVIVALTVLPETLLAARRTPRSATVRTFELRSTR
jgi:hypothetical protein